MLGHEALVSQVLIDLHELSCVLECPVFVFLQHPLVELGLEWEVGEDQLIRFGRGAIEVVQDHDHVGIFA